MKRSKSRCEICRRWFRPLRSNHKICLRKRCQRERHRRNCGVWRGKNPSRGPSAIKVRRWAKEKGYWRWWRKNHPEYCRRDNARRIKSRAAKRDLKRGISLEKLRSIQDLGANVSAKRDLNIRRVDEILAYLVWKEAPQNETRTHGVAVG